MAHTADERQAPTTIEEDEEPAPNGLDGVYELKDTTPPPNDSR
ncbi:hypothetical protein [Parafrankia sp. EAN1pec]